MESALDFNVMVIIGGLGIGKTIIICVVVEVLELVCERVVLCVFIGCVAK